MLQLSNIYLKKDLPENTVTRRQHFTVLNTGTIRQHLMRPTLQTTSSKTWLPVFADRGKRSSRLTGRLWKNASSSSTFSWRRDNAQCKNDSIRPKRSWIALDAPFSSKCWTAEELFHLTAQWRGVFLKTSCKSRATLSCVSNDRQSLFRWSGLQSRSRQMLSCSYCISKEIL